MPRKHTLPLKKTRTLREIDLALIKKNIMEELSPSFNIKHYEKFNHIKNPNDKAISTIIITRQIIIIFFVSILSTSI